MFVAGQLKSSVGNKCTKLTKKGPVMVTEHIKEKMT